MIPLLGIYAEKPETPIRKNRGTPLFIAALLTLAKIWKQPTCPPVGEWIQKLWCMCMTIYSAAGRKKESKKERRKKQRNKERERERKKKLDLFSLR